MSVSSPSAALFLADLLDWSRSNLELQKILYIAHMLHLGQQNAPLVEGNFQAWYLGPVHPKLYHKFKIFGAKPVRNIFSTVEDIDEYSSEANTLLKTYDIVKSFSGPRLIGITHWDHGAWAKNYEPKTRNIIIPNKDILDEYYKRVKEAADHSNRSPKNE